MKTKRTIILALIIILLITLQISCRFWQPISPHDATATFGAAEFHAQLTVQAGDK